MKQQKIGFHIFDSKPLAFQHEYCKSEAMLMLPVKPLKSYGKPEANRLAGSANPEVSSGIKG